MPATGSRERATSWSCDARGQILLPSFTKAAAIHIPAKMDIVSRALDRRYPGACAAASPDEMRQWAVLRALMVPSYAPSRIHLNGKRPLLSSLKKELARSPGVCRKLVECVVCLFTLIPAMYLSCNGSPMKIACFMEGKRVHSVCASITSAASSQMTV